MPRKLPFRDDLPPKLVCAITPPPSTPSEQPPTNLLVLFHGIGDTYAPFETFSQRLQLPETACLALQAPNPMPFDLGGFHWGDDIIFDEATGQMDPDAGYTKSTNIILEQLLKQTLLAKCGYSPRDIILFGFGQGGTVALNVAAALSAEGVEELAGVVSIGGPLPSAVQVRDSKKAVAPVLVCKGKSNSAVRDTDEDKLKEIFEHVQVVEWKKKGDGMPANRDEMLPIMQFFARRLKSTRGVPKGSVEIT